MTDMRKRNKNVSSISIDLSPLAIILTVLFAVLKLTGVVAWSWWWVFSPLLISVGLVLLFALAVLIFLGVVALFRR